MHNPITFSQAVDGYLLDAGARRLSSHTVADYTVTFRKFAHFLGNDPALAAVTPGHVRAFLAAQPVSKKDRPQLPRRPRRPLDLGNQRKPGE